MQYQITAAKPGKIMLFGVEAKSNMQACMKAEAILSGVWEISAQMIVPERYREIPNE